MDGKKFKKKLNLDLDVGIPLMSNNKTLKLKLENLRELEPITKNQEKVFKSYEDGYNLCLSGSAGSGKTFLALYLALEDVLNKDTPYDKVVIIRSVVPTRDIGFLPGNETEKLDAYAGPYKGIMTELFSDGQAWEKLVNQQYVEFTSTSFIRGITISNAIVIVDEMQNLNFHELDSVITRLGESTKLVLCGDYYQSDFDKEKDRNGILSFLEIVQRMKYFDHIEFSWEDIVRSGLVREYIMTKEQMVDDGQIQKI
jgi:phosphate starvation-inducible PhoH-like protein